MHQGLRNPLLTLLVLFSVLTLVFSLPQSLDPRDDICDPEQCNGAVEDNGGDPSYACDAPSKRLRSRSPDLVTGLSDCIADPNCPDPGLEPVAVNCKNCGNIKTAKDKFNGNCDPANSKGLKSSHNCQGSSYLCVHDGVAQCYSKSSMNELANSGALDEISNIENGDAIGRYVRNRGAIDADGKTRKPVFFVIYQTDRRGPQEGFRLALVKEGVEVEYAVEKLKAEVADGATESVVVKSESP